MLDQIVVDDQHVASLLHEIFRDAGGGVRRDVYQAWRIVALDNDYDGVFHGALCGKVGHSLSDGGRALADSTIDADHILPVLVGRFNEVLVEYATRRLRALPGKVTKIWAVGDRIQALVADSGLAPSSLLSVPASVDAITSFVGQILVEIQEAREHDDVTEVYLFHNHPTSGTFYEPVGKLLLPLDLAWQNKIAALTWPTKSLPEVMEGVVPALAAFIREYLFVLLFQACAESLASENASRLAAMQRAEKNIEGILDDLNRSFHRIRQETIDEELFDVISGFDALTTRHV